MQENSIGLAQRMPAKSKLSIHFHFLVPAVEASGKRRTFSSGMHFMLLVPNDSHALQNTILIFLHLGHMTLLLRREH